MNTNLNLDQAAAASKANIELLLSVAQTALSTAESLAALNLHTVREAFADNAKNAKSLLAVKTPPEAAALQAQLAQPAVEKAVAYSRSVYEISTQAQEELAKLVEAQFGDFQKSVAGLMEKAAKSAPVGSDVAVAAVQNAIAAATSAFGNMNTVAKQFADVAQANVAAMTQAAAGKK